MDHFIDLIAKLHPVAQALGVIGAACIVFFIVAAIVVIILGFLRSL